MSGVIARKCPRLNPRAFFGSKHQKSRRKRQDQGPERSTGIAVFSQGAGKLCRRQDRGAVKHPDKTVEKAQTAIIPTANRDNIAS